MVDIEQVKADLALVREARAYTREHFGAKTGTFVGHVRAEDYDTAIDRLLAAFPELLIDGEADA